MKAKTLKVGDIVFREYYEGKKKVKYWGRVGSVYYGMEIAYIERNDRKGQSWAVMKRAIDGFFGANASQGTLYRMTKKEIEKHKEELPFVNVTNKYEYDGTKIPVSQTEYKKAIKKCQQKRNTKIIKNFIKAIG